MDIQVPKLNVKRRSLSYVLNRNWFLPSITTFVHYIGLALFLHPLH
jgi:hypothetical protein